MEITLFSMLGALMFALQIAMEFLPNIHLTGMLTILYTSVFRKKALIPVTVYILLCGVRWGFSVSWMPYVYLWPILWGMAMLIPARLPLKKAKFIYPAVGFLHGILFGTLYAPAQMLFFGFSFKQTIAWIITGLPWDLVHGLGNFTACLMIPLLAPPLNKAAQKLKQ